MERFFGNIGGKLKKVAFFVAVIGIISCVIWGIVIWISGDGFFAAGYNRYGRGDGYCFLSGLLVLCAGSLASYMGSWMLYAFGTLVENTQRIADSLNPTASSAPKASSNSLSGIKSAVLNVFTRRVSKPAASDNPAASTPDTWTCPKCSTINPKTSFTCKDCGHSR